MSKTRYKVRDLLLLQVAVCIYSLNTVAGKLVGTSLGENGLWNGKTIGLLFLEVAVLGVYAILWQQLIKHFQLSIAYANKATTLLWSLVWSTLLFHEAVTPAKLIGVCMVIVGIIILNGGSGK